MLGVDRLPPPAAAALQVLRVRAAPAAEQEEAAETGNFAEEFTREIVDEEKK